jgi:excisionase family DNA binding protein
VGQRLLTIDETCIYLGCSGDLVEELIGMGDIPIVRLGSMPCKGEKDHRKRWIDIKDLDQFIERRKERINGRR